MRVIGIGGIFFKAKRSALLAKWYRERLEISIKDNVALFTWLSPVGSKRLRGRAVPDLVRELVRDFLEEFSFTNTRVMITKTLAVTQLIKQLIAFSRVSKLAMQAHKTGGGTSGEERRLKDTQYGQYFRTSRVTFIVDVPGL